MVRSCIWHCYDVTSFDQFDIQMQLKNRILEAASRNRLHAVMQLLWDQEPLFLATPYKHAFLEKMFLDICEQVNISTLNRLTEALNHQSETPSNIQTQTKKHTSAAKAVAQKNSALTHSILLKRCHNKLKNQLL